MKVAVRDLSVSYGGLAVLDDVSLDVAPGEFVSIVGPSGCGKSTLFAAMAGILDGATVTGATTVDGDPVDGAPFGLMPQQDLLFPWRTVLDNTTLGLEVAGVSRREARERARALFAPFGLDGFEGARPSELSGGMRQRAALLRTVVGGREVLLLDEPFGALDALTRTGMQEWLESMRERYGWTTLLITHDVREAAFLSDRVIVFSPRPATVVREVAVDLPRPRTRDVLTDPRLAAVEAELLDTLRA
ncbi:Hydroxymethylpyrimidine ABC transporter, ATPase component [Pseudonocardia sp. Ae168_Ps1]|uniref:ABC transporter ATP-binding protein n=1 Tax=unclassified Pseudonocardia TaxID=2619320 RepID=UPI0001FFEFF3|nr:MULTISPECIES: ABC transporter ATP-binding protein [unclassified Pseudonocardia]ALE73944.1 ABC transporter [Pseudonocardia sp. EC080625-04]ALL77343.1 ABC transporter [Pseudonocardia sp. EC080610-09]ALL80259.1 ABC transporter [Pseudonocardia sp. EC080619-01]OLL71010.1 Hydroxymethylpyrimidine ABC transporter, ATPase component [Pseudonocardia sp. Ae168_Ps1]OLL77440.1 Hydroxymethylpyrimidine ABC transporter, ATPase component [Pseudonocardia sp. Ae150A_Ps1]